MSGQLTCPTFSLRRSKESTSKASSFGGDELRYHVPEVQWPIPQSAVVALPHDTTLPEHKKNNSDLLSAGKTQDRESSRRMSFKSLHNTASGTRRLPLYAE